MSSPVQSNSYKWGGIGVRPPPRGPPPETALARSVFGPLSLQPCEHGKLWDRKPPNVGVDTCGIWGHGEETQTPLHEIMRLVEALLVRHAPGGSMPSQTLKHCKMQSRRDTPKVVILEAPCAQKAPARSTMRPPEALWPRNPTWESSHFSGFTMGVKGECRCLKESTPPSPSCPIIRMDGCVVSWCCAMECKWLMPFGSRLKELSWGVQKENHSVAALYAHYCLFQRGITSQRSSARENASHLETLVEPNRMPPPSGSAEAETFVENLNRSPSIGSAKAIVETTRQIPPDSYWEEK